MLKSSVLMTSVRPGSGELSTIKPNWKKKDSQRSIPRVELAMTEIKEIK